MSKRSERVRVGDMLDAVQEAVTLARGRRRQDLDTDVALKRALERLIEIVGEAAKGISDATQYRLLAQNSAPCAWPLIAVIGERSCCT